VPITTEVVSSNPIHDEMYSIQHYVIKFVSDLRQVSGFLRVLLDTINHQNQNPRDIIFWQYILEDGNVYIMWIDWR
jgi:hypothetical protein